MAMGRYCVFQLKPEEPQQGCYALLSPLRSWCCVSLVVIVLIGLEHEASVSVNTKLVDVARAGVIHT